MLEFLEQYTSKFADFPEGFVDVGNLMHWQWFAWNLIAVVLLVLIFSKNKKRSWRRLKAHVKSKRAQKEVSLDIQFFILKILYQPLKLILFIPPLITLSGFARYGGQHFVYLFHGTEKIVMAGIPAHVFKALWILMAFDLAAYWSHRIQHQVPFFWHLHSVHHRATYLAPLLKYRTHPFDTFINNIFSFSMGAFAMGIFDGIYVIRGDRADYAYIYLGLSFLVHFVFGHIRHSQYWISYGPYLSRIFMSPAMHQIHHSIAPEHQGKNLATMFSFWDLIFGTIHIPKKKEVLKFGDSPEIRKEDKTLWKEFKMPLIQAFRSLKDLNPFSPHEGGVRKRWVHAVVLAFVALIFGLSSCKRVQAQEQEATTSSCTDLKELSLPAVVLNSIADKNNREIYFPIPLMKCFKPGVPVSLFDPYKKAIGQFIPEKAWSGSYVEDDLEKNPQNQVALEYADLALKGGTIAARLASSLIRIMYPNEAIDKNSRLQIWKGTFQKKTNYYFDDQNLSREALNPSPKIISYQQLIEGIGAGQALFAPSAWKSSSSWRIPTTKFVLNSLGAADEAISLAELQNEVSRGEAGLQESCAKKNVMFYGSIGVFPDIFNVYDWLRALGCKEISWFSGGELEWQLPQEKEKFLAEVKKDTLVTGEDLRGEDPTRIIVDMRGDSFFVLGHIPGALNIQLYDFSKVNHLNDRKRVAFFSFSKENRDRLSTAAKGKKQIVFYTHHQDVMRLQGLNRLMEDLREQYKIPMKLYLGGYRDWENRARWIGEAGGYRIEATKRN